MLIKSDFSLINNNSVIRNENDQSYMDQNNNPESQNDLNQQAQFHHQQSRLQSFLLDEMEKKKQAIYELIRIKNERIRYVLQVQMRQENEMILKTMKGKALFLMNQKEEEKSKALINNMELENLLRILEMENESLKRILRDKETMVQKLNSTPEKVRERAATCYYAGAAVEDEGLSCGGGVVAKNELSVCCNCGSKDSTNCKYVKLSI